jgi:hypothetical protein
VIEPVDQPNEILEAAGSKAITTNPKNFMGDPGLDYSRAMWVELKS